MNQLHPKAIWLFFITSLIRLTFVFLIVGFQAAMYLSSKGEYIELAKSAGAFLMVMAFLSVFFFIWAKLEYKFYKYELTDDGFRKESGVIYKKYVTIPYDRIQNVDIYRGLLTRILGLSDLNIQTAGSSSGGSRGEGRLPGLSHKDAETLRNELVLRAKQSKNQGL